MEIDLKTLILTLALGAIIIHQIHRLIEGCWRSWTPNYYDEKATGGSIMKGAIAITFCFTLGIVAEGLSKSISSDSDTGLTKALNRVIDPDRELRTRCLLERIEKAQLSSETKPQTNGFYITPTRLFCEVLYAFRFPQNHQSATGRYFSDVFERVEQRFDFTKIPVIPTGDANRIFYDEDQFDQLKKDINRIYYFFHNLTYQNDNYCRELIEVEKGMDFARSLTLAMLALSCITVFVFTA